MTIKVVKVTQDNMLIMKCFNCLNQEESKLNGLNNQWDYFEFKLGESSRSNPRVLCLHCNHSYPRFSLVLAKPLDSQEVHLCKVVDGYHYHSKCSVVEGSKSRIELERVDEIREGEIVCMDCALTNWAEYQNIDWFNVKETSLVDEFYHHVLEVL